MQKNQMSYPFHSQNINQKNKIICIINYNTYEKKTSGRAIPKEATRICDMLILLLNTIIGSMSNNIFW
jgi:hypothetical protein